MSRFLVERKQLLDKNRVPLLLIQQIRVGALIYDCIGTASDFLFDGTGHSGKAQNAAGIKCFS